MILILVGIELNDRKFQKITCLSLWLKVVWRKTNWNPKETTLSLTVNLFLAVPVYDCRNESVPVSTVLLYDPSIRFLHSEHIPYVIISVFVIIVFILLPALLLFLYPARCF